MFRFLNQAAIVQDLGRDLLAGVEVLIERPETDLDPALLEDVRKAAFRQTAMQRHLAAFKTDLARITRTRLLSLLTATGGLAQTGSWTTADAFLFMSRSLGGLKRVQTDRHLFLLHYAQQVRHFRHRAARRIRVRPLNDLIQFPQAQTPDDRLVLVRRSNKTPVVLDTNRRYVFVRARCSTRHNRSYISSTCLPRKRASSIGSFIRSSASNVARTTLCGFVEPNTFVRTSCTPTACMTARTAPPAITPVPSDAGLTSTRPAPYLPINWCGSVLLISGTRIRFFFADSMPFLIARGTSRALPVPKPTCPPSSPTTTSAANERFLPPLTTLVTRLMEMT